MKNYMLTYYISISLNSFLGCIWLDFLKSINVCSVFSFLFFSLRKYFFCLYSFVVSNYIITYLYFHYCLVGCVWHWYLQHESVFKLVEADFHKTTQRWSFFYSLSECVAKALQSCPTLCDAMKCNPPGFSVRGILQVKILKWVAFHSP